MARKYTWAIVVGLLLVGVLVVLRVLRGGGGVPPAGQGSPQAVLRKAQKALADGNKALFLECLVTGSRDERAAAEALFDYVQAAYALRDALRQHYGKKAWDTLVGLQPDHAAFTAFVWPRGEDIAATAQITVQGSEATVQLSPGAEPLTLRLEVVWRIEAFPRGSDLRARAGSLTRAAKVLREACDRAGKAPLENVARHVAAGTTATE